MYHEDVLLYPFLVHDELPSGHVILKELSLDFGHSQVEQLLGIMQARIPGHHRLVYHMHHYAHCDWLWSNKKRPDYLLDKDCLLLYYLEVFADTDRGKSC